MNAARAASSVHCPAAPARRPVCADRRRHRSRTTPPRQVFDALWTARRRDVDAIIEARGLQPDARLGRARAGGRRRCIAANPKSVEEFRAGKEKAFNALVGQAMRRPGKADPARLNALLRAQAQAGPDCEGADSGDAAQTYFGAGCAGLRPGGRAAALATRRRDRALRPIASRASSASYMVRR